jgi:hypothetical protein
MIFKRLALFFCFICASILPAQTNFSPATLHRIYQHPDGFYSYAPSLIDTGSALYVWTCHNKDPFVVRDSIFMSKIVDGQLVKDQPVFAHSSSGWDSFHVCDPSVVQSDINFENVHYRWAMFFLGNDVNQSTHNQIGVALAESIDGPWKRLAQPVLHYESKSNWGVGQPSCLPLDGRGRFLVVYSGGGLHSITVDLSDPDHVRSTAPIEVTVDGLQNLSASRWPVGNVDIAFTPDRKRIFAVADVRTPQSTYPSFITSQLAVLSISSSSLENGGGKWQVEAVIGPQTTGFPRNHNAGLIKTVDGTIADSGKLSVVFTRSCSADSNFPCKGRAEWTYDLWEISARLPIHSPTHEEQHKR